ncbi:hypothetical protein BDB01DRAFT_811815 [Pilobolus umbonatus]|nr:hypothetical protein BDB01DRAFT_811815 [Pilobolus umbonatus]
MTVRGFILVFFLSFIWTIKALNVSTISECPNLIPRSTPPVDVTDLRIDDFKMIAGLGDSIMSGFGMMGINHAGSGVYNLSFISDYRGESYLMGGNPMAVSVANFMQHFNPNIHGASLDQHITSLCSGLDCDLPMSMYYPFKDNLNAAQTGSLAMNLQHQLDYLIPRMKSYFFRVNYNNDWKLINIQIGSNDQCSSCEGHYGHITLPDSYGRYLEEAILRIRDEIPKVVINLVSNFRVSQVFPLSANNPYCVPNGLIENTLSCSCHNTKENLETMDRVAGEYDVQMQQLATKYQGRPGGTFAVIHRPLFIDISSFPIEALSNIDCFHPSLAGHKWLAKVLWNRLFLSHNTAVPTIRYNQDEMVIVYTT